MADSKLSDLTAASALDGTELYYTVQGGADRKATGAQIGPLTASVTVSSAEILLLFTTPKTIIAAPGVGYAIEVLDYILEWKFITVKYTLPDELAINWDGVGLTDRIDGKAVQRMLSAAQSQFAAGSVPGRSATGTEAENILNRTAIENKAVTLIALANPTLGDGVLYITLRYRIYAFQG